MMHDHWVANPARPQSADDHISRIVSLLVDHTSEELAAQDQVNLLMNRPGHQN